MKKEIVMNNKEKNTIEININKLIQNSGFLNKIKMKFEILSTNLVFSFDEPINELEYRYLNKFWRDVKKIAA